MEIIVLLLFLAFFYYLGTRLLRSRSPMQQPLAANGAGHTAATTDDSRFRRDDAGANDRPRQPVGSAIRGTRPGIADTSDSIG